MTLRNDISHSICTWHRLSTPRPRSPLLPHSYITKCPIEKHDKQYGRLRAARSPDLIFRVTWGCWRWSSAAPVLVYKPWLRYSLNFVHISSPTHCLCSQKHWCLLCMRNRVIQRYEPFLKATDERTKRQANQETRSDPRSHDLLRTSQSYEIEGDDLPIE